MDLMLFSWIMVAGLLLSASFLLVLEVLKGSFTENL